MKIDNEKKLIYKNRFEVSFKNEICDTCYRLDYQNYIW